MWYVCDICVNAGMCGICVCRFSCVASIGGTCTCSCVWRTYVNMFVFVWYVCVYVHECAHEWRPQVGTGCSLELDPSYNLELTDLVSLASQFALRIPVSIF